MATSMAAANGRQDLQNRAETYERARDARIRAGERMRSQVGAGSARSPQDPLKAVGEGEGDDPIRSPGVLYRERRAEEQSAVRLLREELSRHPAWPWLAQVAGITPVLAGQLLARLDVTRAGSPSAFWAYCGLATVPRPGGGRMAQPSRGSEETKRLCHALGASLLRANSTYAREYRAERTRLEETRAEWAAQRRHLTALRKMEKLFLAHLWLLWREEVGLPITEPHEDDPKARTGPWDMVRPSRRRWLRNAAPQSPRIVGR